MKKINKNLLDWRKRQQLKLLHIQKLAANKKASKVPAKLPKCISPSIFSLSENRDEFLEFIKDIRLKASTNVPKFLIDLSKIEKLTPEATLRFCAEVLYHLDHMGTTSTICCKPPKMKKPRQVFFQLGLLQKFKITTNEVPSAKDVKHWRFAQGNKVDGALTDPTLGQYDGKITDALSQSLYKGLIEAMNNAKQHAYEPDQELGIKKSEHDSEWWMLSQEKDGNLFVSFCDLGVGIPETIPKQWPEVYESVKIKVKENIAKLLRNKEPKGYKHKLDGAMIKAATQLGRSQTKESNRGKGLQNICSHVIDLGGSMVLIHSNHGSYLLEPGSNGVLKENSYDYDGSIEGTIISWKVPLAKEVR